MLFGSAELSILFVLELVLLVYWIAVVVLIVSEDREPTSALAWLLVLMAMPILGLLIYFFFGRNWPVITQRTETTKRKHRLVAEFMPTAYQRYSDQIDQFRVQKTATWMVRNDSLIREKVGAQPLPTRTCEIFGDGQEYFDTLIADLAGAQRFIHMSYFIWKSDALTARITQTLLDRLAAGVEVRILNDFLGCLRTPKDEWKRLRAAGAKVDTDMSDLAKINYRNHRKITVVDGEIGHTGGFNVAQEYIDGGKRFPAWRDTGLRMTGPGVADLEKLFDIRWYEAFGEDLFRRDYYPDPDLPPGEIMVQTVHHGYDDPWRSVTRSYQVAISGARERILLQSPYFVPDASTMDVLVNAAASGVRVDLMTTGWLDKKIPWYAAESFFDRFLDAGGRIWLWEKGFFHAKSLTVDDTACAIGTLNLDMRSLHINKELMVWIYDPQIVASHRQLVLDDLDECRELTLQEVRSWSRARRARNSAARLLSNLL